MYIYICESTCLYKLGVFSFAMVKRTQHGLSPVVHAHPSVARHAQSEAPERHARRFVENCRPLADHCRPCSTIVDYDRP